VSNLFLAYLPESKSYLSLGSFQLVAWAMSNGPNSHPFMLSVESLSVSIFSGTANNAVLAGLNSINGGYYQHIVIDSVVFVPDPTKVSALPEPSTYSLMAASVVALAIGWRKRHSRSPSGTALPA
jgi:hypothetical protein